MKFTSSLLSEEEQRRIHAESLRILSEVGVRFHGQRALPLLAQNGAKVDPDTRIAKIPPEMVSQAIESTPKSVVLGARNPIHDYALPAGESHYCIDGTASFVLDFESGERRYGTRKDIEQSLRVFQPMDMGVMAWAPTVASDAPAHTRALHEFVGIMKATSKHGQLDFF